VNRLLSVLVIGVAGPLAAQTDPEMVAAVRLAQEGQGDSARTVARKILTATPPGHPRYAEALFTVAMVAATPDDRRLHLQRLAVEYSQSDWADDALLLLAQLEYAAGNPAGTVENIQRLIADYPLSPMRATGALWGARAAFDQRDRGLACLWSDIGLNAAGTDVETRNQLEFQRQRCRGLASAESTSTTTATPPPAPPPPPPPARGWQVQVAAFRNESEAQSTVARLERLQYSARMMRDGAWFKVRAGPFADRDRAQEALDRIRRELRVQPFLVPPP
jgi:hypothetical protein